MINNCRGKSTAILFLGESKGDENHQWTPKEQKKCKCTQCSFNDMPKNVFTMLNYCYNLKA